jgi:hypothetical protein
MGMSVKLLGLGILLASGLAANVLEGPWVTPAGDHSRGVLVVDLDGDGLNEVAVANFGSAAAIGQAAGNDGSVQVFKQEGGTLRLWQTLLPGKAPRELAAIDLGHDGKMDLLVTVYGEDKLAVFTQNADHSFTLSGKVDTGSQPVGLSARQVQNRVMVAVANYGSNSVSLFSATAGGGLVSMPVSPIRVLSEGQSASPTAVAFISLGGESYLVTANYNNHTLSLINPSGGASSTIGLGGAAYPCKLAVGDLDGDEREDLAVACFGENAQGLSQAAILRQQGVGLAAPVLVPLKGKHPNGIALGDVAGTGRPWLVLAGRDSDLVDVIAPTAAGGFELKAALDVAEQAGAAKETFQGPVGIACGDLNGDGRTDLVCGYNRSNGSLKAFLQQPPKPPVLKSASHPDPEKWYPDPSPAFSWDAPEDLNGISGYRWVFNQEPASEPAADQPLQARGEASFSDRDAGVWTLSVQAVDNNGHAGRLARLAVRITAEMSRENTYNWPNPSKDGRTFIRFPLPEARAVQIKILDETGYPVWSRELSPAEVIAGVNQVLWEGVNGQGRAVANGGYILQVHSAGRLIQKKIAIIR